MPTTQCGFNSSPGVSGKNLLQFHGPTLEVLIGFDPSFAPALGQGPDLPQDVIHALVDTGATECCIDAGLAMQLNLPVVDQRQISGVGGTHDVNMHLAQIFVPSLNFTMYGAFAAVNLAAGGQQHLALMGRSFLQEFKMVYDGTTGSVSITNDPPELPSS